MRGENEVTYPEKTNTSFGFSLILKLKAINDLSKLNPKKSVFTNGIIAGGKTNAAGKYTNEQLLRRVTLANLLFESDYYQKADVIMSQIESLIQLVEPDVIIKLALEC